MGFASDIENKVRDYREDFGEDQVDVYLQLERVKSALIDFGRLLKDIRRGNVNKGDLLVRLSHYHQKLVKASHIWGLKPIGENRLLQLVDS